MFQRLTFDMIPRWRSDRHEDAFAAFCKSAERGLKKAPKTGRLGISGRSMGPVFQAALALHNVGPESARRFFETQFVPLGFKGSGKGFVTGYYEPEIQGSRRRQEGFDVPLYRHPPDLVKIDPATPLETVPPGYAFARKIGDGYTEYDDRPAIEDGALENRGLELVYLKSKVEAFFVHIQGSAKIRLTDGSLMRVSFSGKSGHPYTPIGKFLIEDGVIDRGAMTADALRGWLDNNGPEADALMRKNRSFIFFKEVTGISAESGPVAAAGVTLTPGRSLAVDRLLHTFSTPIWVSSDLSHIDAETDDTTRPARFDRLMIAQDTGSAIVGSTRGDIFIGTGKTAATLAGRIKHPATFVLLAPKHLNMSEIL